MLALKASPTANRYLQTVHFRAGSGGPQEMPPHQTMPEAETCTRGSQQLLPMSLLISRLDGDPGPSTVASSDAAKQLEALERENAVLRSTVQCLAAYLPDDVAPEVVGVSLKPPPPSCLTPDKRAETYHVALAESQ